MRRTTRLLSVVVVCAALVVLIGCRGEDCTAPSGSAFETLTAYLAANDMDIPDMLNGWIIAAADVVDNTDDYYILDIRSADDYDSGHIDGAVHSSLGNILTDAANSGGKTILVACYTGQSAAHAVIALRLSGYTDAKVLKFGMSSWNVAFDRWTANCANIGDGHANWSTDATATLADFADPDLSASASTGAGILAERVDAMLAAGFKGIDASVVLAAPGSYFINNYWAESDVNTYGHIAGAYRIKEDLTLAAGGLGHLDPTETIVTYCWTGQTSSMITAYLTVLGYDAKSLKFGTNAMIYDDLQTSRWSASADYAYVTE